MCHSDAASLRDSLRLAGIKGLQGVIRKTVSDDLVENIWEAQHMEKIVPSLLFNMQVGIARVWTRQTDRKCLSHWLITELISMYFAFRFRVFVNANQTQTNHNTTNTQQ